MRLTVKDLRNALKAKLRPSDVFERIVKGKVLR